MRVSHTFWWLGAEAGLLGALMDLTAMEGVPDELVRYARHVIESLLEVSLVSPFFSPSAPQAHPLHARWSLLDQFMSGEPPRDSFKTTPNPLSGCLLLSDHSTTSLPVSLNPSSRFAFPLSLCLCHSARSVSLSTIYLELQVELKSGTHNRGTERWRWGTTRASGLRRPSWRSTRPSSPPSATSSSVVKPTVSDSVVR